MLNVDETNQSPLSVRLSMMLRQLLPLAATGGALVVGSGVMRGQSLLSQLAIGGSIAVAAVPEGLPLLAGVGEAAVARRLASRNALVRRLAAVEALGRVDIACTDKTGTLTEGRLALRLVADTATEAELPTPLSPALRAVLLAAALASPHPAAGDAAAHPTDVAVIRGAQDAGLDGELGAEREREAPFDPARPE
jgi:cation-transporting ATPase I